MQATDSKWLLQHLQEAHSRVQELVTTTLNSPEAQELQQVLMQQWLAAASCIAALALLLATIAAGWVALWHTTMKDVGFFREIMGLNKPRPEVKAQRQAEVAAEIERIKRQASRGLHARHASQRAP